MRVGVAAAAAVAAALVLVYARRRSRSRFASMVTESPPETVAALNRHKLLALRHKAVPRAIDPAALEQKFEAIRAAFAPQQVDYANTAYGKNHWKLSCFMEYTNGVAAGAVDLAAGAPMLGVLRDVLAACDAVFLPWWETLHPRPRDATRQLVRMQSFVTRYRPSPDETHLPRHIDGAQVDGSLVLGLPTYSGFGDSGGLTVWDGDHEKEQFVYPVAAGDACLLDSRVWHQSNPIACGERWVLVIFYEVRTTRADGTAVGARAVAAPSRQGEVRELLARRIKDAAKRREASAAILEPEMPEAWKDQ
jgi:hypothetical protein